MKTYFASLVLLVACGGSPLDPGSGDSTGSGTATLVVNGSATARPQVPAAAAPSEFQTSFDVRITLANAEVTTGTVTITSATGKVPLAFNANGQNNGSWQGDAPNYDEVYQLDVVSGTDTVSGVRVDGPDIHTFSAPLAGASVDSTMAMPLAWTRNDTADAATLRVGDGGGGGGGGGGNGLTIVDTGTYSVAPGTLHSNKDQATTNTLRLTRTNRVTPTGAAGGSELSVSVENDIDVVALPNPNALR